MLPTGGRSQFLPPQPHFCMTKPYNPNTQGWGFALVVCLMTAGLAGMAYTIHNNTYRHPRDPMTRQVYADQPDAHGAPAAEGADEAH